MTTLIVTPDDSCLGVHHETALLYDLGSGEQTGLIPHSSALESIDVVGRPPFRPFGIEKDGSEILIASNDKIGRFAGAKFLGLAAVPAFANTHQIRKHDGVLYVCNSANDTIGVHAEDGSFYINVADGRVSESVLPPTDAEAADHYHVNTLEVHDGALYYCLHNLGRNPSQFWKYDISRKQAEFLFSVGHSCHGIKIVDGTLWTLSTGTGELVGINKEKQKYTYYKIANPESEFLRGLDYFDGSLYYGVSDNTGSTVAGKNGYVGCFDFKLETKSSFIKFPYTRIADLLIV
jgi:hypothetical protein